MQIASSICFIFHAARTSYVALFAKPLPTCQTHILSSNSLSSLSHSVSSIEWSCKLSKQRWALDSITGRSKYIPSRRNYFGVASNSRLSSLALADAKWSVRGMRWLACTTSLPLQFKKQTTTITCSTCIIANKLRDVLYHMWYRSILLT